LEEGVIKVIKAHQRLTQSLKSPDELAYEEDRALAEFRSFYQVASLHTTRVHNTLVINTMLEILENLRDDLNNVLQKSKTL